MPDTTPRHVGLLAATGVAAAALVGWGVFGRRPASPPTTPPVSVPDIRISRTEGAVYLRLPEHPEDHFAPVSEGTPLEAGDILRTGHDGFAEIAFENGSLVELGPDTYWILEFATAQQHRLYLRLGSLVARIAKLEPGWMLEVRTPTAVAAVRGTEFAVTRRADERLTRVAVFDEGRVAVRSSAGGSAVELAQRQEAAVGPAPIAPTPQPLSELKPLERRIAALRERAPIVAAAWAAQPAAERAQRRKQALTGPTLDREAVEAKTPAPEPAQPERDDSLERLRDQMRREVRDKMRKEAERKIKKKRGG